MPRFVLKSKGQSAENDREDSKKIDSRKISGSEAVKNEKRGEKEIEEKKTQVVAKERPKGIEKMKEREKELEKKSHKGNDKEREKPLKSKNDGEKKKPKDIQENKETKVANTPQQKEKLEKEKKEKMNLSKPKSIDTSKATDSNLKIKIPKKFMQNDSISSRSSGSIEKFPHSSKSHADRDRLSKHSKSQVDLSRKRKRGSDELDDFVVSDGDGDDVDYYNRRYQFAFSLLFSLPSSLSPSSFLSNYLSFAHLFLVQSFRICSREATKSSNPQPTPLIISSSESLSFPSLLFLSFAIDQFFFKSFYLLGERRIFWSWTIWKERQGGFIFAFFSF